MAMISFASNREDVRLARVLTEPAGFYIDVGAADPTRHSITRHFSDRGWRGINVEARAGACNALQAARPNDISLNVAVSDREGEAVLHEIDDPTYAELTTLSSTLPATYRGLNYRMAEQRIATTTLASICERHAPDRIDFLSVDVEGHEHAVLAGHDWKRWRPRIVVVEAIDPVSHEPAHAAWEPLLLGNGYLFAAFDGVNRFYVREEDASLVEPLARPMSVLDRYEPHDYIRELDRLRQELSAAGGTSQAARALVESAQAERASAWAAHEALRDELVRLRGRVELLAYQFGAGTGTGVAAGPLMLPDTSVGPGWLALARRGTRLSRRFPRAAAVVKAGMLRGRASVRRWRS